VGRTPPPREETEGLDPRLRDLPVVDHQFAVFELGVSPYLTAVIVSMIAALFIELISEVTDAYNDVSMAIVLSTGFALGTTLISINAGGLAVGDQRESTSKAVAST
jgi:preprotein translocase subunit SecY